MNIKRQTPCLALALLWFVPFAIAAESDYELVWLEQTWRAENPQQRVQTIFQNDGVQLTPRGEAAQDWTLGLSLLRCGRSGRMLTAPPVQEAFAIRSRFEFQREGIVEWYVNSPGGLEQGFEIDKPFAGPREQPLTLDLALSGTLHPIFSADGQSVEFFDSSNDLALRYDKLVVIDARGAVLPSHLEGFSGQGSRGVRLVVDDRDAAYPIVIDPLMTTASWIRFGSPGDQYGDWVAAAGDVNADGYGDVLVGNSRYANGQTHEGRAELFLGTPSGLATTAAWSVESNEVSGLLGKPVASAGDINADGYVDIAVGCPYCDVAGNNAGAVYVYFGSATGPSVTADIVLTGTAISDEFGFSVSTAGDFNNDGFSDLIVGSRDSVNGYAGKATIFTGSSGGLTPLATFVGDAPLDRFGFAVGGGGDFNDDGFDDVVVGAPGTDQGGPDHGGAHVWLGAASGVGSHLTLTVPPMLGLDARMGGAVAFLGDTDGDGTSDFVVGADGHDNYHGAVVVFNGPNGDWAVLNRESGAAPASPPFVYFGFTVAAAGDVNDDGYADLLVGSDSYSQSGLIEGAAYVFTGPFGGGGYPDDPVWTKVGDPEDLFGTRVTATDVNGDGRPDMIVSAIGDDVTPDGTEGSVSVFHSGIAAGPSSNATQVSPGGPEINVSAASAGDVNGDGFEDVLGFANTGSRLYLGHPDDLVSPFASWSEVTNSGHSATAGDVDGDGYDDVLVADPLYSGTFSFEGRVSLYRGSSGGLTPFASWTFLGGVTSAEVGVTIARLGDINGDGFSDVAVGAPFSSNGEQKEGQVFVFHGSASGLSPTPDWVAESDQASAYMGRSLDSAGDVNGDGYSDMIVGVRGFDGPAADTGLAWLYFGGPGGLTATPVWQGEVNVAGMEFGEVVVGAGDLNGDGFADVAVGAPEYSNPETQEGGVWIYYGSPTGPGAVADWSIESDSEFFALGGSIVPLGDTNGDGFSELWIGQVNSTSHLVFGSALGPSMIQELSFVSVDDSADINGDGYADMIRAAGIVFDFYLSGEGTADSADRRVQLRRNDDSAPVAALGASDSNSSFGFVAQPSTQFGNGDVAVEVEVKPIGVPFDGLGTIATPFRDNTTAPALELVDMLAPGTLYHWRTRQVYDPVTQPWFPRGPWLPTPNNAWAEPDFRTAGSATASAVPDGNMVPGTPLTVSMDETVPGNPLIILDWGESCGGEATDYAIYIGTIGDFASHVPCTCSTGGLTNFFYPPDEVRDQYYLVVPVNAAGQREGSYGVDSGGNSRPASLSACYPTGTPATCNP